MKVVDLCKKVDPDLVILSNIRFEINAGDALAILGASGSGKTTLLGLLAGLDNPTSGKVYVEGVDLFSLDEDERAKLRGRSMGFVFQAFHLLPALTALENVMLPCELSGMRNARKTAADILERVGLSERMNHYPKLLSGGEQQRVAIARAFVTRPMMLLADEPTGNLDAATGEKIIDLMFELNREQNTTLVLVTHDDEIAKRCSRRIRLKMGRQIE